MGRSFIAKNQTLPGFSPTPQPKEEIKMANELNINETINTAADANGHTAYNGKALKEGEVLVPMLLTEETKKLMDINPQHIRTWQNAGVKYEVIFFPVQEAFQKVAMSQFNSQVNELLGTGRDKRCLIKQPDGTYKKCPKKNGNNRCSCAECPNRGKLPTASSKPVSLDEIQDDLKTKPSAKVNIEETVVLSASLDFLIKSLEAIEPRYAKIIQLIMQGYTASEIISDINLNKSRGYQEIKNAQKLAKELYYK